MPTVATPDGPKTLAEGDWIFGSDARNTQFENLRELKAEAKANGLAVVVWGCPRGSGVSKEGETAFDIVDGVVVRSGERSESRQLREGCVLPRTGKYLRWRGVRGGARLDELRGRCDRHLGTKILAKSLFKEVRGNGYSANQILSLSTELIDRPFCCVFAL